MSLYSRMKADNKRILGGDDMQDVTLYDSAGASKSGTARVTSIDMAISTQGQRKNTKKWSIAFHIDDYSDITGTNENYKNWQGSFVDSNGDTLTGVFNNIYVDKTFGYVETNLTGIKVT